MTNIEIWVWCAVMAAALLVAFVMEKSSKKNWPKQVIVKRKGLKITMFGPDAEPKE